MKKGFWGGMCYLEVHLLYGDKSSTLAPSGLLAECIYEHPVTVGHKQHQDTDTNSSMKFVYNHLYKLDQSKIHVNQL